MQQPHDPADNTAHALPPTPATTPPSAARRRWLALSLLLACLPALLCLALAQTPAVTAPVILSRGLALDQNGVVLTTNFWTANAQSLANASTNVLAATLFGTNTAFFTAAATNGLGLYGALTNYVAFTSNALAFSRDTYLNTASNAILGAVGATFATITTVATKVTQMFQISSSGLSATIGPGSLFCKTGNIIVNGGTVNLQPNTNNFIVINYGTLLIHCLSRKIGDESHLVAVLQTNGSGVTNVIYNSDWTIPASRIGRSKAKLLANPANWYLTTMGDSETAGGGSGNLWNSLMFSPAFGGSGYNVTNINSVVWNNVAVGGTTTEYGLAQVSKMLWPYGLNWLGYCSAYDSAEGLALGGSVLSGDNCGLFSPLADLFTLEWVNSCNYQQPALEGIVRELTKRGSDVLMLTGNANSNNLANNSAIGIACKQLRDCVGGAVADTWAYVDEINKNGTNTYFDVIHQNQIGWNAWAEAVLGAINPLPQETLTIQPETSRTLGTAVTSENPLFGLEADFVGGTALEAVNATVYTTSMSSNSIPSCWNDSMGWIVTTNSGANGWITFTHPCWTWAALIFQRGTTNSFSGYCAFLDSSGNEQHPVANLSYVDAAGSIIPGIKDLYSISDTRYALTNFNVNSGWCSQTPQFHSGPLRIVITNGAAAVLGVVFGGPHHYGIPCYSSQSPLFNWGIWGHDSDGLGYYPGFLYSDTLNDWFALRVPQSKGFMVCLRRSPAGGQLKFYQNGFNTGTIDAYVSAGQPPFYYYWLPGMDTEFERVRRDNTLTIKYYGNNSNKGTATTGKHAMDIWKIEVFD